MATVNYIAPNIKKRTTKDKYRIYHKMNLRSGLYKFLGQNFIKLIIALLLIVLAIFLIDYIFDLQKQYENLQVFVTTLNTIFVFAFFLLTESILGFIPPDIFIVWGQTRYPENAYLIVAILGTLSYIGGINAYFLGRLIRKLPSINNYVQKKYEKNFNLIEKWGGLVIIMAALFPLPFAMTSTVAGIVRYPFKSFLLYGLTRYIRFFLYAVVIFGAIEKFL
jgi:membrane protein YqaA with SNARE-associated domain